MGDTIVTAVNMSDERRIAWKLVTDIARVPIPPENVQLDCDIAS